MRALRRPVTRRSGHLLLVLVSLFAAQLTHSASAREQSGSVEIFSIQGNPRFPDAAAPRALQFVCSSGLEGLKAFFSLQQLPFEPALVFDRQSTKCHIFYQPTVKGFQAALENWPIESLYFDLHTISVMSGRPRGFGDALDIAASIADSVDDEIGFSLGLKYQNAEEFDWALQQTSAGFFRAFELRNNGNYRSTAWTQDYIKSGVFRGQRVLFLPRHLYEGSPEGVEEGDRFLESIPLESSFRSQLSWDGGDLILISHPKDAGKRILFYGWTARMYWGQNLSRAEYEYVLKQEFGADLAVDASEPLSHADYLISFIADKGIALIAAPVRRNRRLAEDALQLYGSLTGTGGSVVLRGLERSLVAWFDGSATSPPGDILGQLARLRQELPLSEEPLLPSRDSSMTARDCLEDPMRCFSERTLSLFLRNYGPLVRDWTADKLENEVIEQLAPRLLEIIRSQIRTDWTMSENRSRTLVETLNHLGFKVIPVPRIAGDLESGHPWPGLSMANSVVVRNRLFVPTLGLGESERESLAELSHRLPPEITLVPVYARHAVAFNGGIHCVTGIVRRPPPGD